MTMSLKQHLERLKQLLSEEDRVRFEQLNQRINQLNGDFSALNEQERAFVAQMERKYGDKIRAMALEHAEEVVADNTNHVEDEQSQHSVVKDEFPLLKTEFAEYVKDMLLRELKEEHRDLKAAVTFAYQSKWLPQELRNPDVCETLYERFFSDIERANQWRFELQGKQADENSSNKTMAVGLTWFMYVYQLKQWVDKYQ
jgi:hypothetical protein